MHLLFSGRGFLQIPHLERVIFGGCDENRLGGVERQAADGVEVTAQGELGVPCLTQGVFIVSDLRAGGGAGKKQTKKCVTFLRKTEYQTLLINTREVWCTGRHTLTS